MGGGSHAAEEDSSGAGAAADAVVAPAAERELVRRAVGGDRDAVTEVVRLLQDSLYRLALRMLARPADAEDATQEILVRVLGHLGTWRGEAALLTWAYRIGVNYLLNLARRTPLERAQLSLDAFGDGLRDGLATADYRGPEAELLTREMRLSCSQAMLQCLARDERVAFVLSEVFDLGSTEAAWIVGSTPAAHRKRLERAKRRLGSFLDSTCGLANPTAFCRCARRIDKAVAIGRLDPAHPVLATHPVTPGGRTAAAAEQQMIRLHDAAAVLRSHPDYAAPQARMAAIAGLLSSDRFPLLAAADLTTGRAGSVLENGGTEREAGVS
ncbi:RNA polymerase sigma factor [Nocardia sp. alder85J]|uniref:RNA polymerase sigma factor n=1 Tax=Nocardia sp. alder85J TaxID=2862949 RepID=UPI001CD351A5|nr:RNA polymerase sigma factor [Nocardia sp. alder85J]MCX4098898.1 RNA polymerase sigma factor [Nocardia sp. alder85J]